MNFREVIINLLGFSVGSISISAGIVYLAKCIFNKWMDAKIIEYQYDLNSKLEEFKIKQQELSEIEKIRFDKLHEERAQVIKELYSKVVEVQRNLRIYVRKVRGQKKEVESNEDIFLSLKDYIDYIDKNRIFFDENITRNLIELGATANFILGSYEDTGLYNDYNIELNKVNLNIIDEDIKEIKKELEKQFRTILGVY